MKLYKFEWYSRAGSVEGLFIAEPEEIENIIGKYVYFGEILGKYSDVAGTVNKGDITELLVSEDIVSGLYEELGFKTLCGYNPIDYYDTNDDEPDEDGEE